jgi:hypothetical protein
VCAQETEWGELVLLDEEAGGWERGEAFQEKLP